MSPCRRSTYRYDNFIRFEDFTRSPDAALEALCANLDIRFDPGYRDRWPSCATITGDTATQNPENEIRPRPRRPMEPDLIERFTENANYRRAIEILGYGHPE